MTEIAKHDVSSSWIIDTQPLTRQPGQMLRVEREIQLDVPMGLDLMTVPAGQAIHADLRAETVAEGVLISGTVTAPINGECARCLDPVRDMLSVEICELFAYPDSTTSATTDADEVNRLDEDRADVEQAVRDALILAMPETPHCEENCRGLCPECGERLADLDEGHAHEQVDSRWEELRPLLEDVRRKMSGSQE